MISQDYQIELRHYRYFLAVAEELHFRKAAEKLFISQPGLSTQIKQMEELLGVELFTRNKKKVQLTAAGEYLKEEAEFILNHLQQTRKQTMLIGSGALGEIRIGFLGSAMQNVVPDLLVRLQQKYPDIHTSLEELSNQAQLNLLLKDKLDLAFVRVGRMPTGLERRTVVEDTFSLVLPEDYPLEAQNFKRMSRVQDENFILFSKEYSPEYFNTVMGICEDAGFTPKVNHKSVHALTIFRLVEKGMGLAIIPTSLTHGFDMKVKFIELKKIEQRALLSVAWKKDNRNPVLQHCLNLLLKE
ncbi:LysR family transcriptional regulator [Croceivirga thetidis]|uniref:LysR family transcriptional regulator n=1 Tax=Croceivirga thetidis TaxID=2721623 RepID=A0ABX1GLF5_9FLAO|nr:LysR family transcriptional regulator [Croceivirga thetidis]NKI30740.1 LysR family transcriptional regulator [Croceivirga thetidis]